MKRQNKRFSALVTGALFTLAVGLLLLSTVGGARAALRYSDTYGAHFATAQRIGVQLLENGTAVPNGGALLSSLLAPGESLQPGRDYTGESLAVTNTGSIPVYARVVLTCSWEDGTGRRTDLDPSLIGLNLSGAGWIVDNAASTPERTVLYYTQPIAAGATSAPLVSGLTVSQDVQRPVVTPVAGSADVTVSYPYQGVRLTLRAEADVMQTHNAEDAALSGWGRGISVAADGTLSLKGEGKQ